MVRGRKIHCDFRKELRTYMGKRNLRKYLYDKGLVAWKTFPDINWELLDIFMEKQTREFKLWFTKHVTNFCGIGKMMKRMKLWNDDLCPCCRQIPEHSTNHLYIYVHIQRYETNAKHYSKTY